MLRFEHSAEFSKDLKTLAKRWRSLPTDIVTAQAALEVVYSVGNDEIYRHFFAASKATVITKKDTIEVVKMRLDCKSLGSDKKTRLVFVVVRTEDVIYFVELFAKNEKDREDPARYRKIINDM